MESEILIPLLEQHLTYEQTYYLLELLVDKQYKMQEFDWQSVNFEYVMQHIVPALDTVLGLTTEEETVDNDKLIQFFQQYKPTDPQDIISKICQVCDNHIAKIDYESLSADCGFETTNYPMTNMAFVIHCLLDVMITGDNATLTLGSKNDLEHLQWIQERNESSFTITNMPKLPNTTVLPFTVEITCGHEAINFAMLFYDLYYSEPVPPLSTATHIQHLCTQIVAQQQQQQSDLIVDMINSLKDVLLGKLIAEVDTYTDTKTSENLQFKTFIDAQFAEAKKQMTYYLYYYAMLEILNLSGTHKTFSQYPKLEEVMLLKHDAFQLLDQPTLINLTLSTPENEAIFIKYQWPILQTVLEPSTQNGQNVYRRKTQNNPIDTITQKMTEIQQTITTWANEMSSYHPKRQRSLIRGLQSCHVLQIAA